MDHTLENIVETRNKLNDTFYSGKTCPLEYRLSQLRSLKKFMEKEQDTIQKALAQDLRKCSFESYVMEISVLNGELDFMIKNLEHLLEPEFTPVPAAMAPAYSEVHRDPFGVTLIIVPFNYPVQLAIAPLIGSIAGGNCCVMKPSEVATATEKLLYEVLPMYLDPQTFAVVKGDVQVTQDLLKVRWDKIFFTGSTRVGKIIMKAASDFLTPVSLELGGKSPTIIDKDVVNLEVVCKRIAWGKTMNAGQTCVAPDYVYCHEKHYDAFLQLLKESYLNMYSKDPKSSNDLGRIITKQHYQRLKSLVDDAVDHKAKIYYGGDHDERTNFLDLTILTNVTESCKVMKEEIFGPILPVFKYSDIKEVIQHINSDEKPLVMYLFSSSRKWIDKMIEVIPSGDVVTNDCLFHAGSSYLPFGGVGHSGMGAYHGKFSIDAFTYKRSVLRRDAGKLLDIPAR
jgi:aldehyde dehydrogenase (NAD+)